MKKIIYYDSPVGRLGIAESSGKITNLFFDEKEKKITAEAVHFTLEETPLLKKALKQLDEYFSGKRKDFDLTLAPAGTDFQKKVWGKLLKIKYGETVAYGDIATGLGKPGASRAVGMANHRNPIAIIIPCHRVIGADGSMTGYAAGLDIKAKLLELEKMNHNRR